MQPVRLQICAGKQPPVEEPFQETLSDEEEEVGRGEEEDDGVPSSSDGEEGEDGSGSEGAEDEGDELPDDDNFGLGTCEIPFSGAGGIA